MYENLVLVRNFNVVLLIIQILCVCFYAAEGSL